MVRVTAEEPAQVLDDLAVGTGVPLTAVFQQHRQPLASQTLKTNASLLINVGHVQGQNHTMLVE